jgi:hypothetical protein
MQDSAVEVESNILVVDRLRNKVDRDIPKKRSEASTSGSSTLTLKWMKLTKMVKTLSARDGKMKVRREAHYRNPQNIDNRGNFRRPNNNVPQIMPREQRNRDRDDQRIQTPLQNNLVADEEGEEIDELGPEIHCIEDTSPFPHLTQSAYEESLMNSQINELSKGEKANR